MLDILPAAPLLPLFGGRSTGKFNYTHRLHSHIRRRWQISKLAVLLTFFKNIKHGFSFPVRGGQLKPAKPHSGANGLNNIASPFPMFWLSHLRNLEQ